MALTWDDLAEKVRKWDSSNESAPPDEAEIVSQYDEVMEGLRDLLGDAPWAIKAQVVIGDEQRPIGSVYVGPADDEVAAVHVYEHRDKDGRSALVVDVDSVAIPSEQVRIRLNDAEVYPEGFVSGADASVV